MPLTNETGAFIRLKATKRNPSERTVMALTGLGKTTIYRLISQGEFPKPVKISGTLVVRWRLSDVLGWMNKQGVSEGD